MAKLEGIKRLFVREFCLEGGSCGGNAPAPVFIIGLPRSGTTLLEQILASHPMVHAAGEPKALGEIYLSAEEVARSAPMQGLVTIFRNGREEWRKFYSESLGPVPKGKTLFTDKMPLNFPYVGLARFLFPEAKFICIRRDPLDACVSMYCHPLAEFSPATVDLEWLGQYYNLFEAYLGWWERVFPGELFNVQYENLVRQPKETISA
ncbi:MAG TPA: sulfotransferase, partial [Sphingomonadales bacterium]|nr:sulfotransferase [Sphingomonadales bacterium]